MDINLSNQQQLKKQITPAIISLRDAIKLRKIFWDNLNIDQKKKWIKSGKDPIMTLTWNLYKELDNFFDNHGGNDAI